jgi:hypothetical protein
MDRRSDVVDRARHWLQPLYFGFGAVELVLGWLLRK